MFKSIGVVIILWYFSIQFSQSFKAADDAISATFNTLEVAIVSSQKSFK